MWVESYLSDDPFYLRKQASGLLKTVDPDGISEDCTQLIRHWTEQTIEDVLDGCHDGVHASLDGVFFVREHRRIVALPTFLAQPGIYLEDLYVKPDMRGKGVGSALLQRLARIAVESGCGRLEWQALDWNKPSIQFYKNLGAQPLEEWTTYRLTGKALDGLAFRTFGA